MIGTPDTVAEHTGVCQQGGAGGCCSAHADIERTMTNKDVARRVDEGRETSAALHASMDDRRQQFAALLSFGVRRKLNCNHADRLRKSAIQGVILHITCGGRNDYLGKGISLKKKSKVQKLDRQSPSEVGAAANSRATRRQLDAGAEVRKHNRARPECWCVRETRYCPDRELQMEKGRKSHETKLTLSWSSWTATVDICKIDFKNPKINLCVTGSCSLSLSLDPLYIHVCIYMYAAEVLTITNTDTVELQKQQHPSLLLSKRNQPVWTFLPLAARLSSCQNIHSQTQCEEPAGSRWHFHCHRGRLQREVTLASPPESQRGRTVVLTILGGVSSDAATQRKVGRYRQGNWKTY